MARDAKVAPAEIHAPWNPHTIPERTDAQLLQDFLCKTDESAEAAFAALVERHGPIVHRVCFDILGNRHEAQDAAQAVFLVLSRKARSIRKPESLGPWLHGVALRVARRAKCEAARQRAAEHRKAEITSQQDHAECGPEPMDFDELHEEIDRLPDKYRLPLILCYMQGQTQPQAAQTLGWPLGTVQIRLHRGRERLRSRLSRAGTGLIALTGSDLTKSLSVTTVLLDREWTQATARAAVRFAARKATAGLIAPSVAGLARAVLATMVGDSLKVLTLIAVAALLGVAGLSLTRPTPPELPRHGSLLETKTPTAATRAKQQPAPITPAPEVVGRIGGQNVEPSPLMAPAEPKAQTAAHTSTFTPAAPTPAPPLKEHPFDGVALPKSPMSSDRARTLALLDRRSEKARGLGRELFERIWTRDDPRAKGGDGLGPVFNGQSCVVCHNLGGSGGAGAINRNIEIVTATGGDLADYTGYSYSFSMDFGAGKFEYRMGGDPQSSSRRQPQADPRLAATLHAGFQQSRSVVLHRYGTDPAYSAWRESLPGRHGPIVVRSSERNPPPLFGSGRIDAIPDEAIEAAAKRRPSSSAQVKGRVSRLKDGRIGRFGWKAQTATLEEFVLSAAAGEMGLEIPGRHQGADPRLPGLGARGLDMDQDECNLLVEYVRSLPVPVAVKPADDKLVSQIKAGETTFKTIGCASCHLPKLGEVEGIYSDLLLHDMGPQLGDADTYTVFAGEPPRPGEPEPAERQRPGTATASAREWRTPPLWGLRESGPYLHDGRATGIAEAISMHSGQGATAARRFAELPPRRKQQLEAFLTSLAPPSADR
jgi:RNA polymerase sigma factor (sigma-70 family)